MSGAHRYEVADGDALGGVPKHELVGAAADEGGLADVGVDVCGVPARQPGVRVPGHTERLVGSCHEIGRVAILNLHMQHFLTFPVEDFQLVPSESASAVLRVAHSLS